MNELTVRNRHRGFKVNLRHYRTLVLHALRTQPEIRQYSLGIELVPAAFMARLNQQYLAHEGPTDIITFDHAPQPCSETGVLMGDLIICLDIAARQADEFHTHWTSEVARYTLHGLLHLIGFDDQQPAARRRMKQEENRRLKTIAQAMDLSQLNPQ